MKKLAKRGFAPCAIATSPLVRCRQTAEVICERLVPPPALAELPALEPGSHLGPLIEWSNAQGVDELAWVGHAPDVNWLAAALVGARETGFDFAKGAVAAIAFDGQISEGAGTLLWLATPKSLGA